MVGEARVYCVGRGLDVCCGGRGMCVVLEEACVYCGEASMCLLTSVLMWPIKGGGIGCFRLLSLVFSCNPFALVLLLLLRAVIAVVSAFFRN